MMNSTIPMQQIPTLVVEQTSKYHGIQRYVVLSFDKMKKSIQACLNKHSNELIGFVDLGEEELGFCSRACHPCPCVLCLCPRRSHRCKVYPRLLPHQGCHILPNDAIVLESSVNPRDGLQFMGLCSCERWSFS